MVYQLNRVRYTNNKKKTKKKIKRRQYLHRGISVLIHQPNPLKLNRKTSYFLRNDKKKKT